METVLEVPLKGQELKYWCWAAVASALTAWVPGAVPTAPCRIAGRVYRQDGCADPETCNDPQDLVEVLGKVGIFVTEEPPSFGLVKSSIARQMPAAARMRYNAGSGAAHFILVVGCNPDNETVVCADPNSTPHYYANRYRMPYEDFRQRYGGWGHCEQLLLL